ncbi:carbohydrate ABC transporter permease [Bifidobacterium phasiani]|uniref:Carbohydrate ABC transporter permease n=1 Tax=Bifidobacterium phasiani TaxID=2834431 RepID=A0ABS6W928_9BIFI|nr:carbohydrate ABC transporter permease [Bifidobacterium phasiani]MBW3082984.1 carbohydrate ABC transporter permease [Bifidobacterium phasiani]
MSTASVAPAAKASGADIPFNPKVHYRKKASDWVIDIVIWVLLALVVVAVLYPLWFVVISSVSSPNAVASGQVTFLPKDITMAGYQAVFENDQIWNGYLNTIVYTVLGTIVNLVVTIPCAFALSRAEFRARRVIMFLFTVTMFFSGGLIPTYLLYQQLGMLNSALVFILPGAISAYNVIVARTFFETSIPEELHDAAQIDGMSYFGYFFRIVIPLSSAIIAVIGLYCFVAHWNDYMTGLIYVTDTDKWPLQNVLQQILLVNASSSQSAAAASDLQQIADQMKFAIIIISTLPLLVLYPFLQKYFNKGVMLGAVKG